MDNLYAETLISKANEYIRQNKKTVNGEFKPKLHLTPPVGWMNDPNGLVFFKGEYHLFYQFTPYGVAPEVMLWGHAVSKDLYSFEDLGVALAPDDGYSSIYSGGAIDDNGVLNLIYTRHSVKEGVQEETVCRATSSDGRKFQYCGCVFDNEKLPKEYSRTDFRDPYPVKIDGKFYLLLGGKKTATNEGVIIVLKGETLEKFEYAFTIGPFNELGEMGECPSFAKIGDKHLIVASGCKVPECGNSYKNENSTVFILGKFDFENGNYRIDRICEVDKGDAFYAAQIVNCNSQPVMIGWNEMWGRKYYTGERGHGWVGAFSSPRVLSVENNEVLQQPFEGLNEREIFPDSVCPRTGEITFVLGDGGAVEITGDNGKVAVKSCGYISLDTTKADEFNGCIRRTDAEYEECDVKVIIDSSSIEVFVAGGRETISSRIYVSGEYKLQTSGNVKNLKVKEISVKQ